MKYTLKIAMIMMALCFSVSGYPKDKEEKGQHKGPDTSMEHKSDQGLEHGEAYAGTREKNEKEDKLKEEKESRDKKEKKSKKEK